MLGLVRHRQQVHDGCCRVLAVDPVRPAVRVLDPSLAHLVEEARAAAAVQPAQSQDGPSGNSFVEELLGREEHPAGSVLGLRRRRLVLELRPWPAGVDGGRGDEDGPLGLRSALGEGVESAAHAIDVRRPVALLRPRPCGQGDHEEVRAKACQDGRLARQVDGQSSQWWRHAVGVAPQRQHVVPELREPETDGRTEVAAADEEDVRSHRRTLDAPRRLSSEAARGRACRDLGPAGSARG